MGNDPLGSFQQVAPAIRGRDVPRNLREGAWSLENVQGSHPSANHTCTEALAALAWSYHHDLALHRAVLDAWEGYFESQSFFGSEPYGCHYYGDWIATKEPVRVYMALAGHRGLALVDRWLRVYRVLLALGATPGRYGPDVKGDTQHRATMCGSRSWIANRPGADENRKPYYDDQGRLYEPYLMSHTPHDAHLCANLGLSTPNAGLPYGAILSALKEKHPEIDPYGLGDGERKILKRIQGGEPKAGDLDWCLDALDAMPKPNRAAIPAVVVRTTKAVAWVCEGSTNLGNKPMRYAQVYYLDGQVPDTPWQSQQHWTQAQLTPRFRILAVDPPANGWGVHGHGELDLESGVIRAIRDEPMRRDERPETPGECHYDIRRGRMGSADSYAPGPLEVPLPGDPMWAVRYSKKEGAEDLLGDVVPDEEGGGWKKPLRKAHRILSREVEALPERPSERKVKRARRLLEKVEGRL